jgi:paraquat-inducible protein B
MSEVLPDGKPGEEAAGIFPTATIQDEDRGLLRSSKMWWVTGLCMLLALWLTWQSRSPRGKEIIIQFPEGHGLKPGDLVRFRGIEVGLVTAVTLRENLSGINVAVSLTPSGGELDGVHRIGHGDWR